MGCDHCEVSFLSFSLSGQKKSSGSFLLSRMRAPAVWNRLSPFFFYIWNIIILTRPAHLPRYPAQLPPPTTSAPRRLALPLPPERSIYSRILLGREMLSD